MSRSTVLAFVLFAGACTAGTGGHIVPRPAKPAEPRSPTDFLLRMALAEVLKEPWESVLPRRGPVLLLRDGPTRVPSHPSRGHSSGDRSRFCRSAPGIGSAARD